MKRILIASFLLLSAGTIQAQEVTLYSYRQNFLLAPLLQAFTDKTGIKVKTLFAKNGLVERIALEGEQSPADLLLTSDFGRMLDAKRAGISAAIDDETIKALVPAHLIDPEGQWLALTMRARLLYAAKQTVPFNTTISYEDLGSKDFPYRICMRSGTHPYNIGLIASMLARHGEEKTRNWLIGLKNNLARRPQGNDRAQVKAVWAGECDIAIGNSYYYGKMLEKKEQRPWADSVNILFPNQEGHGTHVNISGAVLMKHSPNREESIALLRFLLSDNAQKIYSKANYEYPIRENIPRSELVASWGTPKLDDQDLSRIANLRAKASELVEDVGFDQ